MADLPHGALDTVDLISVEVAYAEPERQFLQRVRLPVGATIADALAASEVERAFGIDAGRFGVGIWSKAAARDTVLHEGDRIELYRPLQADPKESRRRRAERTPLKKMPR